MNALDASRYAEEMLYLADGASLARPISERSPNFTTADAYLVAREMLAQRETAGWRRIGRKIGFTNKTIWDEYGVHEPIFGYMYDRTVSYADGQSGSDQAVLMLDGLAQPRIEPEIFFGLRSSPARTDDAEALLRAIEWVGHGFEIVQCHFPDWQFKAPDTIADGGLHGHYVCGPRFLVEPGSEGALAQRLARFRIALLKNGERVAEGGGELVLGSPLTALAHFIKVLASLPDHPPLQAGELITTGTLTAAMPVTPGETWSTRISGLPLSALALRLE
jgi:2-oxo-3-hexenedioate decarboxylase